VVAAANERLQGAETALEASEQARLARVADRWTSLTPRQLLARSDCSAVSPSTGRPLDAAKVGDPDAVGYACTDPVSGVTATFEVAASGGLRLTGTSGPSPR
jgi:hypothetical protein